MLYEVVFKHTFAVGERTVKFTVFIDKEEFVTLDDPEFGQDIESLAVELAMHKFFKEYTMHQGTKVEVVSVKRVN